MTIIWFFRLFTALSFIGLEHFNFEHWLLFRISDFVLRIYLLYIVFKVIPTAKITPIAQY
jgi:hypothetical protein